MYLLQATIQCLRVHQVLGHCFETIYTFILCFFFRLYIKMYGKQDQKKVFLAKAQQERQLRQENKAKERSVIVIQVRDIDICYISNALATRFVLLLTLQTPGLSNGVIVITLVCPLVPLSVCPSVNWSVDLFLNISKTVYYFFLKLS